MSKTYKQIEIVCGYTIAECVLTLMRYASKKEFVCADFNGKMLYSDTVSMDSAYKEITGMTYYDFIEHENQMRKEIEKSEKEHQEAIPKLTQEYIKKGHAILSKDKWELWDKCVPVRLADLYKGWELDCCLDIISSIQKESIEQAISVMKNQGHSGMSWGLMKSMIKTFSDRGEE